jgi:D-amino peptidase
MKRAILLVLLLLITTHSYLYGNEGLKVFISVDMEGVAGVVTRDDEVITTGKDYDYFRDLMAKETNAAIEGALAAGAAEIIVRDSHGTARNILPESLNEKALLLRDWSGGYMSMMEGIDETFDAVVFIGYHAKAGTPNAILEHTMSSKNITDVSINNISMPESGINALIAGYFDVPVVFISGDEAICNQAREMFKEIETVAVKKGIGFAALNLHPEAARTKIREGVKRSLQNIAKYKPYKLKSPYTLVLTLMHETLVHEKSIYPGATRTGDWELTYKSEDLIEIIKAFHWMH